MERLKMTEISPTIHLTVSSWMAVGTMLVKVDGAAVDVESKTTWTAMG